MSNSIFSLNDACDALSEMLTKADLAFGHGAPDADSEALWILSYCLNIAPIDVLERLDEPYPPIPYDRAILITNQRISSKKPLAYILGEAWLMGYDFICDERSIVPRSYIAELISDDVLEPWLPPGGRALDLCTGNGSLAILLASYCPDMIIHATDISSPALELARLNLEKYNLENAIDLYCGDLFSALPDPTEDERYDLILCNPPYVNSGSMAKLPQEYLTEPALALEGGGDGMTLIRKIIYQAKDYLYDQGALILEIGNEYDNFINAFPQLPVKWLEISAGQQQVCLILSEDLP